MFVWATWWHATIIFSVSYSTKNTPVFYFFFWKNFFNFLHVSVTHWQNCHKLRFWFFLNLDLEKTSMVSNFLMFEHFFTNHSTFTFTHIYIVNLFVALYHQTVFRVLQLRQIWMFLFLFVSNLVGFHEKFNKPNDPRA